ncbi:hypothetical protein M446_2897 [Methylobacterium sp. 4-46]|uniref:hypothetical protein n=1 Tax=unclassified Methylobacterium TaxID=2615210 RepID=UPI000152D182|nr:MULTISPECIES: hypothetical protein [Methylobacterium]ACA17313.1 hypothetical protein M446_2897 [Methylobacterium sp. 4-46]WFT82999.1 hypothetical protein QA634_14695 [Methylobacterium nodulans]
MTPEQNLRPECECGPEERVVRAEIAYCLLERAYQTLALAFERAAPGRFACLNRAVMRDVMADLREIQETLPEGIAAGTALADIAAELRETLLAAENIVCTPQDGER